MSRRRSYVSRMGQAVADASNAHDAAFNDPMSMEIIACEYSVDLADLVRRTEVQVAENAKREAARAEAEKGICLYHVTSLTRLQSVREHGLSGEFTRVRPGHVHLAADGCTAGIYHGHWDEGPCMLLSVRLSDLDPSGLGPDREDLSDILSQNDDERGWNDVEWDESLQLSGNCTYMGAIAADFLTVESYRDEVHGADIEVGTPLSQWDGPAPAPDLTNTPAP